MSEPTMRAYEDATIRRMTGDTIRPGGVALTDRALEWCSLPPGAVVLDVGCGAGVTAERLSTRYSLSACGIDPSSVLLGSARARSDHLPLIRAAAERLPIADASVDAVLAECVLSLLPDAARALAEFARVLRPSGMLVLSDVYTRSIDRVPPSPRISHLPCLPGAMTAEALVKRLQANRFRLGRWEDHSDALARLAVQVLWETGSTQSLWCASASAGSPVASAGPDATGDVDGAFRPTKLGYFLLLADKSGR